MPSQTPNDRVTEVQSRYGYLLKPIRDLFKNWEIDIAAELEEYLHDMEQIKISFDGGQTVMNFAEAALLIQGSACIYSKKVEYLYTLVYQTLDLLASKRQLQQASSVDEQGKDKDVSCHDQQQEEFLLLDDIKIAKNIDLKENIGQSEISQLVPRTPVTLITFDDSKKGSALISHTGEVLGNRNDFKMNTCTVHLGSGALLLDHSNFHLVQSKAFQRTSISTPSYELQVEGDYNQSNQDDMDCGDDFSEDPGSPSAPTILDVESEKISDRMELRERKPVPQTINIKEFKDPWETLDPHDPSAGVEKPFKKGRPFKIPNSVRECNAFGKKRKRKSQDLEKEKLIPIAEFCRQAFHSQAKKLPKNPLKTLTYHEFEYIYWVEFRRRQILERKKRKLLSRILSYEEIAKLETPEADLDLNNNDEPLQDRLDYGEEGKEGVYDDDIDEDADSVNNDNDVGSTNGYVQPMALEDGEDLVVSSYEELVRKYVQGFLTQAQQYVQETDLSRRVKEWERKVVPKLEDEDSHQPYDIHKYGENVLSTFADTSMKLFQDVVVNKEPWEICRYFLASLQLANNYNVEICSRKGEEIEMDCMQLRLLHRTPAHQAISQYRAPSAIT